MTVMGHQANNIILEAIKFDYKTHQYETWYNGGKALKHNKLFRDKYQLALIHMDMATVKGMQLFIAQS